MTIELESIKFGKYILPDNTFLDIDEWKIHTFMGQGMNLKQPVSIEFKADAIVGRVTQFRIQDSTLVICIEPSIPTFREVIAQFSHAAPCLMRRDGVAYRIISFGLTNDVMKPLPVLGVVDEKEEECE